MDSLIPPGGPGIHALLAARTGVLARDGVGDLTLEGVALGEIARALGTPTWVIGAGTIRARYRRLAASLARAGLRAPTRDGRGEHPLDSRREHPLDAFSRREHPLDGLGEHPLDDQGVHRRDDGSAPARDPGASPIRYAVKANDHLAVLRVLAELGAGADVVSGGELRRALEAGIPAGRIAFSGVGKTDAELALAIGAGVETLNVESIEELDAAAAIARALGRVQDVLLRVNPEIEAGGHDKISTGRAGDKFGIALADTIAAYRRASAHAFLRPRGLAVHIGSQIDDPAAFAAAAARLAGLVGAIRADGLPVGRLDAGGGFAIDYGVGAREADTDAVAAALAAVLAPLELGVTVEPGRYLVGPAGVLLASAIRLKAAKPRPFLVIDAAMNDLARPALYGAWHGVLPVDAAGWNVPPEPLDIVGPVCESGDTLAPARVFPALAPGAHVAILDAGAYGAVMSSAYNARPAAAMALVDGQDWWTIRERASVDALWAGERVPARDASRRASDATDRAS